MLSGTPPIAVPDDFSVHQGQVLIAQPIANDTDAEYDSLTPTISNVTHGTAVFDGNNDLHFQPDTGFVGTAIVSYYISDGTSDSDIVNATISVSDTPPYLFPTPFTVRHDLQVIDGQLLAFDADFDPVTFRMTAPAQYGAATVSANGKLNYTPDYQFTGLDQITVVANDGALDSQAMTVYITVTNIPPVAQNDAYGTSSDFPLVMTDVAGVLANDYDNDFEPISATIVSPTAHGTIVLNPDGSFQYTPELGYTGTDEFSYEAKDGANAVSLATVQITVTDFAPLGADDWYRVSATGPTTVASALGVLGNDIDLDDALHAVLVTDVSLGTLILNLDGSFTYTPGEDFLTEDSFQYVADDGSNQSVLITVHLTTQPVAHDDYGFEVNHLSQLTFDSQNDLLINDEWTSGSTPTVVIVVGPLHGSIAYIAGGNLQYTPDPSYEGADSFRYLFIVDGLESSEAKVSLTVTNEVPEATPMDYDVVMNNGLSVDAANGVLSSAYDYDGDTITAELAFGPTHGQLALNPDGSFDYLPAAGFVGMDVFGFWPVDEIGRGAFALAGIVGRGGVRVVQILVLPAGAPFPVPNLLTFSGNVIYDVVPFPQPHNVRSARVELVHLLPNGNKEIVNQTYTNDLGFYSLRAPLGFQPGTLQVVVYTESPSAPNQRSVTVGDITFFSPLNQRNYTLLEAAVHTRFFSIQMPFDIISVNPYSVKRPIFGNNNADQVVDITIGNSIINTKAFWTFDAAITAAKFQSQLTTVAGRTALTLFDPAPIAALLVAAGLPPFDSLTPPALTMPIIHLNAFDDWDTIVHEYGHTVQQNAGSFPFSEPQYAAFNAVVQMDANGIPVPQWMRAFAAPVEHGLGENLRLQHPQASQLRNNQLAYSEGFANFFSVAAQVFDLTVPSLARGNEIIAANGGKSGDALIHTFNIENDPDDGKSLGEDDEINVMRVLWDLVDFADPLSDSGMDRIQMPFLQFFKNIESPAIATNTLSDLWNKLTDPAINQGFNDTDRRNIGALFELNNLSPSVLLLHQGFVPSTQFSQANPNIPEIVFDIPRGLQQAAVGGLFVDSLLNSFHIYVFNDDYSALLLTSPLITGPNGADVRLLNDGLVGGLSQARRSLGWTPDALMWAQVTAALGTKHIVIGGEFSTTVNGIALTTGEYRSSSFDIEIIA